jgi:hypothetical protein
MFKYGDVMSDLIVQMLTLMTLLVGILAGEIIAFRAFGKPKPKILLIDMLVFVVVLTLMYSFVSFTEAGVVLYAANFFIGAISIVFVRGIESLFRLTESPRGEDRIAVNIIRALSRYGLDEEEIKGVLKRSGIPPKTVDRLSGMIEESVPVYVPKLVKLEADVADIKAAMASLSAPVRRPRKPARKAGKKR